MRAAITQSARRHEVRVPAARRFREGSGKVQGSQSARRHEVRVPAAHGSASSADGGSAAGDEEPEGTEPEGAAWHAEPEGGGTGEAGGVRSPGEPNFFRMPRLTPGKVQGRFREGSGSQTSSECRA